MPWSVKGIGPEAREAAKDAARRAGQTLGQWLNQVILDRDDDIPPPARTTRADSDSGTRGLATRLDALADRLDRMTGPRPGRDEIATAAVFHGRAHEGAHDARLAPAGRDRLAERLDRTDAGISALRGDVDEIAAMLRSGGAPGGTGVAALERALFEVVDHIELTDKRNGEVLKTIQSRLSDLAARVQQAPDGEGSESREAIRRVEGRLADLARRVERGEHHDEQHDTTAIEGRLADLAAKVDRARQNPAIDALEARLNQITSRLVATERLMTPQTDFNQVRSELGKLRDEVGRSREPDKSAMLRAIESRLSTLSGEVNQIRSGTASSDVVEKLGQRLETIVARLNNSERAIQSVGRIDAVESRIDEIAHRIESASSGSAHHAQYGDLEHKVREIAARLDDGAHGSDTLHAIRELEHRVNEIASRLGDTERHFSVLGSIESNLEQLFGSIDQSRHAAIDAAEQAAFNAVQSIAGRSGGADEIATGDAVTALERGLAEVKSSATAADRHNQETLEAIHDTLKRVIERVSTVEERVVTSTPVSHSRHAALHEPPETDDIGGFRLPPMPALKVPDSSKSPMRPGESSAPATRPAATSPRGGRPSAGAAEDATDFSRAYDAPPAHGHSDDFIAAARRAARAANDIPDNNGLGPDDGRGGDGASRLKGRKRTLLFTLAALFIIAGALSLSGILSRNDAGAGARSASIGSEFEAGDDSGDPVGAPDEIDPATATANYFGPAASSEPASHVEPFDVPTSVAEVMIGSPTADGLADGVADDGPVPVITIDNPREPETRESVFSPTLVNAGQAANAALADAGSAVAARAVSVPQDIPPAAPKSSAGEFAALAISGAGTGAMEPAVARDRGAPNLTDAAEAGDPAAQFEIASRFADGRAGRTDLAEAANWYQRAAAQGLAPAQYRLGAMYEKGQGVPQDKDAARIWYQRAAEQGNLKAMHNLAVLLAGGVSGGADYARAARWFLKASELGLADSQYNLAVLHERGLGVQRDLGAAYKWFAIASAKGDTEAEKRMNALAGELDPETLARASAAYQSWQAAPLDRAANVVEVANSFAEDPAAIPSPVVAAAIAGDRLVAKAQSLLSGLGYDPGPADGQMGPRTRDAIAAFERERGLPETGIATPEVINQLELAVAG